MRVGTALLATLWGCSPPEAPSVGEAPRTAFAWDVVCADGETIDGIDVSYWQGSIDWDAVANTSVEFAFIRVADGLYEDTQYDTNWSRAREVGIVRGTYQYFRPGTDPQDQAELLLDRMGELQDGDLPPVLDVETSDGYSQSHVQSAIQQWMDVVEPAIGRQPIIYTGLYTWNDDVGSCDFSDYPLWIAQYEVSCPDIPDCWDRWDFWQTSSSGSVSGISGNVDTNLFNGDLDDLLDFAGASFECGDGICNGDETPETCPEDCPACEALPPEGGTVDETDICFEHGGNSAYWYTAYAGYGGTLAWTHTTDSSDVDNYGIWNLNLEQAGSYLVEVYIDTSYAQSQQASYQIAHADGLLQVVLDQSAHNGWSELGSFDFDAGEDQFVRLDDNTGEPYSGLTQIVFDALRLTRLDGPGDSGGFDTGDSGAPGDTGDDGDEDEAFPESQDPDPGGPRGTSTDGCGCGAAARPAAGWAWLLLAGLGLMRRRR